MCMCVCSCVCVCVCACVHVCACVCVSYLTILCALWLSFFWAHFYLVWATRRVCFFPPTHTQHAPQTLHKSIGRFVGALIKLVGREDARSEANLYATENAVSTLAKIVKYMPNAPGVDAARALGVWLANLPFVEDEMEARVSYDMLCEFVEANNPHIVGAGGCNLPRVVNVMATALVGVEGGDGEDAVNAETLCVAAVACCLRVACCVLRVPCGLFLMRRCAHGLTGMPLVPCCIGCRRLCVFGWCVMPVHAW